MASNDSIESAGAGVVVPVAATSWTKGMIALACAGVAFASLVSLAISGFSYGVNNNVFNVPIVLNLSATDEFKGDVFYGSLSRFTSVVWPMLGLFANEENVRTIFLVVFVAGRVAALAALACLFWAEGARGWQLGGLLLATVVSPWMQGESVVGDHGIFIRFLTHSELTWPFVWLYFVRLSKGHPISSGVLAGLSFCLNAFVGIWLVAASGLYILYAHVRDGRWMARFSGAFLLTASPVVVWMMMAIRGGGGGDFSFLAYVREYHSAHFLIEAASSWSLKVLALFFINGFLAAFHLKHPLFWLLLQAGLALLLVVGIPLPYVVDNRFVFNLHLMRSTGLEQALATVLVLAAGGTMVCSATSALRRSAGLAAILAVTVSSASGASLIVAAIALAPGFVDAIAARLGVSRRWPAAVRFGTSALEAVGVLGVLAGLAAGLAGHSSQALMASSFVAAGAAVLVAVPPFATYQQSRWPSVAMALLLALSLITTGMGQMLERRQAQEVAAADQRSRSWADLVKMIRNGDAHGPFLVPVRDERFNQFQLEARRPVWVDWKQGAAVMWEPAFYRQWSTRLKEVRELRTTEDFVRYAARHGIRNVVVPNDFGPCTMPAVVVHVSAHYSMCRVEPSVLN